MSASSACISIRRSAHLGLFTKNQNHNAGAANAASEMVNAGLNFVCRDVHIKTATSQSLFTAGYEAGSVLRIPVAHHDGQYFADDDMLSRLQDHDQVAFRYTQGDTPGPANPNGSVADIAGIYNKRGTILGMMPHPENAVEALVGGLGGKPMFDGLADEMAAAI